MQTFTKIIDFITNNQTLLATVILCFTFIVNKIINYMASKPEKDIWDQIQPYSSALYKIVFDGAEYLGKSNPKINKAIIYSNKLSEFEKTYNSDKTKAIKELFAWYEAAKGKKITEVVSEKLGELLESKSATSK